MRFSETCDLHCARLLIHLQQNDLRSSKLHIQSILPWHSILSTTVFFQTGLFRCAFCCRQLPEEGLGFGLFTGGAKAASHWRHLQCPSQRTGRLRPVAEGSRRLPWEMGVLLMEQIGFGEAEVGFE